MKKARRIFQFVALGIIFYLSLQTATVQTAILLDSVLSMPQSGKDAISLYETRFMEVRTKLRSGPEAVGYISCPELDADQNSYHYFLTQYVLTPTIIKNDLDHELILGNFPSELCNIGAMNLEQNNLSVIQEFDDGIVLLKRSQ
ncbi:MAG: hypothetical protein IPM53_11920 [Anaerolineaceae bacterium]|nr:hypothetical protein [Anaerolineaceae bacterium]